MEKLKRYEIHFAHKDGGSFVEQVREAEDGLWVRFDNVKSRDVLLKKRLKDLMSHLPVKEMFNKAVDEMFEE